MNFDASPMQPGDFTRQADHYAAARPAYPASAVDSLIADAALTPGQHIADIGAGTGIFTALLSGRGFQITALEPNDRMRSLAPPMPDVRWFPNTFEQTGLSDQSQHWVVAAQAFHWADPAVALPELHRILRPGARLTVLWNDRHNAASPILQWTQQAIHRYAPDFDDCYRGKDWAALLSTTGHFTDGRAFEFPHTVPMDRPRYLNLWRSHNRLNIAAGPDRFEAFIVELDAWLTRQDIQRIDVPYICRAWSVRRVD